LIRDRNFRQSRRRDFDDDSYDPPPREFGGAPRFGAPRFEAPSGPPVQAVVKWFKPERGFGFVELADGFGCAARRVEQADELEAALRWSFESAGPTLVAVAVDDAVGRLY